MENCQYGVVNTNEDNNENLEKKSWTPFLRQLLVCSSCLSIYFSVGICFGAPAIYIQQIRKEENSTDVISVEMASNLSSIFGYSGIPWIFILTAISHFYGRKKAFLLVGVCTVIIFICFYFSVTTTHLLIVSIMEGIPNATCFTVSLLILAEYTSAEYRGIFLTMKSASVFWGVWFANVIGTFFHWKYIPMTGFFCSLYSLLAVFWPESPHWLASKRRHDECRKSHRWLKGHGIKAEQELEHLTSDTGVIIFGTLSQIKHKEFYRPTIIACLMIVQYYASGKLVCSIYSIEILKKITDSEKSAYSAMLILDGVTVFGMYVGCFLNGVLKRRFQLFTTSAISIILLFILSLYLYLMKMGVCRENNVLTIILLVVFSIAVSCGPAIMAPSTFGEMIPYKYKNMCTIIVCILFSTTSSTILKIFPYIYIAFGLHGTFLFYGVSMSITTAILYVILPETKDKTMYELEEYFKRPSFVYYNKLS